MQGNVDNLIKKVFVMLCVQQLPQHKNVFFDSEKLIKNKINQLDVNIFS